MRRPRVERLGVGPKIPVATDRGSQVIVGVELFGELGAPPEVAAVFESGEKKLLTTKVPMARTGLRGDEFFIASSPDMPAAAEALFQHGYFRLRGERMSPARGISLTVTQLVRSKFELIDEAICESLS